jgi:aldose sugar dehydrogenase
MLLISIVILVATGACFQNRSPHAREAEASPNQGKATSLAAPTLVRTDFMSGLNRPWDMVFTPDGAMLFTEKCRGLSVRRADGSTARLFGTTGSAVIASDLFCEGQSGMHGVAIDPDFASNRTLYVYMASNLSTNPRTNRVVRLTIDSGYTTVANRLDIITDISYKDVGNSWGSAGAHSGGRIRFGADGFLYVTTGDNHNGPLPQDLTKLGGKVLRVDRHGNAAPGNQTPEGGDARIFTYGHRNVQGIAFHPTTGQPYIAEHGPGHSDEVTPLTAGGNGGWDPKPEAGVSCADDYCGYISNKPDGTPTPMTDTAKFPHAMQPLLVPNDSQGMGPCTFLTGSQWKGWG